MNAAFPKAQITGYNDRVTQFQLPDLSDHHVLAATLQAGAGSLVTFNLKDFPAAVLAGFEVAARHPDDVLMELFTGSPEGCHLALERLLASFRTPPMSILDISLAMDKLHMPRIAHLLRELSLESD